MNAKSMIITALVAASASAEKEQLTLRKLSSENRWTSFKKSFAKIYVRVPLFFFNYNLFRNLYIDIFHNNHNHTGYGGGGTSRVPQLLGER